MFAAPGWTINNLTCDVRFTVWPGNLTKGDMLENKKYGRFMIFAHHGGGTMGGYYHGLDAVMFHTDNYSDAEFKFNNEFANDNFLDVKLFDRETGVVLLSLDAD